MAGVLIWGFVSSLMEPYYEVFAWDPWEDWSFMKGNEKSGSLEDGK